MHRLQPVFKSQIFRQFSMASVNPSLTTSTLSSAEIELIDRVHTRFPNKEPYPFHFFYRTASPFSNFHPCTFQENGVQFNSTEQYMMYQKAKLFADNDTARAIIETKAPGDCKALGRGVQNFDTEIWQNNRARILADGIYLKFTQDERLKQALMDQNGRLLVEAAVNDGIWGVGLQEKDPLIKERSKWKGLNLLGYILTDIAHRIQDESNAK